LSNQFSYLTEVRILYLTPLNGCNYNCYMNWYMIRDVLEYEKVIISCAFRLEFRISASKTVQEVNTTKGGQQKIIQVIFYCPKNIDHLQFY
jgi:hypothetical protein